MLKLLREFLVARGIHEARRAAVGEYLLQLVCRAARPERDENDTGLASRPEGINIFQPVLGEDADAIAQR